MVDVGKNSENNLVKKFSKWQIIGFGVLCSLFLIYPDITWIPYEISRIGNSGQTENIVLLICRFIILSVLISGLIDINLEYFKRLTLNKRFGINLAFTIIAFVVYGFVGYLLCKKIRHYGSLVLFQFFIVSILTTLFGHIAMLYLEQRKKEKEIEELRIKNIMSSYDALTNQINPHFFFNSLNGLASLIRKKEDAITLTYLEKLSDVFRYILQSHKKGLVTLADELEFVHSFQYMMEVRFADKMQYQIDIDPDMLTRKLPVLSILPLLDNIVVHNVVDSDYKMLVRIWINEEGELCVSNPIHPKLVKPITNGTGLANLKSRFQLLIGKSVRFQDDGETFTVSLPLK